MADFKRKDAQKLAYRVVEMIEAMRTEMAGQDATIQRQAAEIERLRAALAGHIIEPVPQEVLADIDSQLCEDCEPFTSVRIIGRLQEHGWRITRVPHHDDPA